MSLKSLSLTIALGMMLASPAPQALAFNGGTQPQNESPDFWFRQVADAVEDAKNLQRLIRNAKNVILFVGDGMGVSTVTAARILEGQQHGQSGEENNLSFELFPHVALSKVYNTNQQTPDSAGTMTAMITGVKTKAGVISVNQNTVRGDCDSADGNELKTLLEMAEERGKSTGVVTTARLTHATPAATYAHVPERNWENDSHIPLGADDSKLTCHDIARQLVEFPLGDGIEVAMGGGRREFLPNTFNDPEDAGQTGSRTDGRNLADEWQASYPASSFIWNQTQFDAVNPATTDHLLGLFERSHMEYEFDRSGDAGGEPSLSQMTGKALQILQKNRRGFFLHVESGRIDHGHHAGNAYRALTDAIEFSNAVQTAVENTDPKTTLILVTADHSHVFAIAGYPTRGNSILGKVVTNDSTGVPEGDFSRDSLGLPYTTLGYTNGPGYTGASVEQPEGHKVYPHFGTGYTGITAGRPDLETVDTADSSFMQEATVPLGSETHAAEDVAIYAKGPKAYLLRGVQEQNVIYHIMRQAFGWRIGGIGQDE